MRPQETFAATIFAVIMVFITFLAMAEGAPLWSVAVTVVICSASAALGLYLARLTHQDEEPIGNEKASPKDKSRAHALAFAVVAGGGLLFALQGIISPAQSPGSGFSGLLTAVVFGFLALREYRSSSGRTEPYLTLGDALQDRPTTRYDKPTPTPPRTPAGSPKTTLLVIAGIVIVLVAGNIRRIRAAAQPNDVWIGVGQMALYLPIFGYLVYREFRRMGSGQEKK